MAWWKIRNSADDDSAEMRIEGDIKLEPDLFEMMFGIDDGANKTGLVEQIRAIGNRDLTVWIDSPGGDLIAGAGIYTALCAEICKSQLGAFKNMPCLSLIF